MTPSFEHVDAWLLSLTKWQLRQLALIIALTINIPNAWLMEHCTYAFDAAETSTVAESLFNLA